MIDFLMLHRQDHKPQGDTWGEVAGKVSDGEDFDSAMVREIMEETGLVVSHNDLKFIADFYVRYPEYDFLYHSYKVVLTEKPKIRIDCKSHKAHKWLTRDRILRLPLIGGEYERFSDYYYLYE